MRLFGRFELWDAARLLRVERGAEAAVVKLLALHRGVLFREQLCAALWPEGEVEDLLPVAGVAVDGVEAVLERASFPAQPFLRVEVCDGHGTG